MFGIRNHLTDAQRRVSPKQDSQRELLHRLPYFDLGYAISRGVVRVIIRTVILPMVVGLAGGGDDAPEVGMVR